jgi:DnaJ-class molecular chaperone
MKPTEQVKCWECNGFGIVDRGYHNPGECPTCDGKGYVVQYESGVLARYPGGPLLGREQKAKRA